MSYTLDVNVPRKNDPILGKGSHEAINDVVKNNWYTGFIYRVCGKK